jgi:hypothetical protein
MVNVRNGPKWASIGFAHDAEVGVRPESAISDAARWGEIAIGVL